MSSTGSKLHHHSCEHGSRSWCSLRQFVEYENSHHIRHSVMLLSPSPYTASQEMFERTLPASFGSSSRYIKDWLLQLNSCRSACNNNSPVDHRSPCPCLNCKKHPSSKSHHTRYAKSTLASHPGTSNVQTLFAHVQYLLASRSHLYVIIDQRTLKSSRKSWTSINISWRCGGS